MTFENFILFMQIVGPGLAAWVSVKVAVAQAEAAAHAALEKAIIAKDTADKAHVRIDSILTHRSA